MPFGISVFTGPVARSREFDALAEMIGSGSITEDERALERLKALASEVETAEAWNRYALGLYSAHRHLQAAGVLVKLLEEPNADAFRLNLAASYSQVQFIDLCRHHLRHVAMHGADEGARKSAEEQLQGYEDFLGLSGEVQHLRALQIEALDESTRSPDPPLDMIVQFARLLLSQAHLLGQEAMTARAQSVLEQASRRFPEDDDVIKLLLQIHIGSDDETQLSSLLDTLRNRNHNSPLLRFVEDWLSQGEETASIFPVRAAALTELIFEQDDTQKAALNDLARLVVMHPGSYWIRLHYSWGLLAAGNSALAKQHAARLAAVSDKSHAFHFNLGQVLWLTGDKLEGRRHLELAVARASSPAEAQEARERIKALGESAS